MESVAYPRFGPFGAKIGKIIPTKPQKPVINNTGRAPIFLIRCVLSCFWISFVNEIHRNFTTNRLWIVPTLQKCKEKLKKINGNRRISWKFVLEIIVVYCTYVSHERPNRFCLYYLWYDGMGRYFFSRLFDNHMIWHNARDTSVSVFVDIRFMRWRFHRFILCTNGMKWNMKCQFEWYSVLILLWRMRKLSIFTGKLIFIVILMKIRNFTENSKFFELKVVFLPQNEIYCYFNRFVWK